MAGAIAASMRMAYWPRIKEALGTTDVIITKGKTVNFRSKKTGVPLDVMP